MLEPIHIAHVRSQCIRFTVTEDHIKLLKQMCVGWDSCEFGAPAIDCKRPYGSLSVYGDMAEIIGIPRRDNVALEEFCDEWFEDDDIRRMDTLHQEMKTVLEIGIRVGIFCAGEHEAEEHRRNWRPVSVRRK